MFSWRVSGVRVRVSGLHPPPPLSPPSMTSAGARRGLLGVKVRGVEDAGGALAVIVCEMVEGDPVNVDIRWVPSLVSVCGSRAPHPLHPIPCSCCV